MKKYNIIKILLISVFIISCGSSDEDEVVETPIQEQPASPSPIQGYTPPQYTPPNSGGGTPPVDAGDDDIAQPLPGDLGVGTHIIAQATEHTSLYANQYWNANYYGSQSDLSIQQVYVIKGDEIELNIGASLRTGEREGSSCNKRSNMPLTVWVGSRAYFLWPYPFLNKVKVKEDGAVSIGTHSWHLKEKKPCIVVKNLTLKVHAY